MRDKGLNALAAATLMMSLPLFVLGDIAVLTVVKDPTDANGTYHGANTWQVRGRLWGDAGIGQAAQSVGMADFLCYVVKENGAMVGPGRVDAPNSFYIDTQEIGRAHV